ncbi:PE family protein [Mycobacterium paragordonae]|uniref:PE family protein n=1 Tax=Mycobacterium paragordonae TaxID=1389713 RepID=UPI0012E2F6D6|nr:PE family protein [Mycobacterium paragordonae]
MSSFVFASPDVLTSASHDLAAIESAIRGANFAAAPSTTSLLAAAEDEVSAAISSLFSGHAQQYQALSAQASAFHDTFVNLLGGGALQYVSTEIAGAKQMLANTVNASAQSLLGSAAASSAAPDLLPLLGTIALLNPFSTEAVVSTGKSLINTFTMSTSSTKSYSYGTGGTQTVAIDRTVLNLEPLANEVQGIVQGSLGSQWASTINQLSGTPLFTSTTISGSDPAGKWVTSVDYRTLGGFGIGVNGDTANQSYSANLIVPGFDISLGASPAGFYGSSHVAGSGGALAVNNGSVIASLQVGAELSKNLSLGDASATIQVNTATGNVSGDVSLSSELFGAFKGDLLLDPGDGIPGTYTQSGWLNSLLLGTSAPVSIPLQLDNPSFLGSYPPALNPSTVLNDLTSGVNFSSLNKLTVESQVGGNIYPDGIVGTWREVAYAATGSFDTVPINSSFTTGAQVDISKTGSVYTLPGMGTLTPTQPQNYTGTYDAAMNQQIQSFIQAQSQLPFVSNLVFSLPWDVTLSSDGTVMNLYEHLTWTWVQENPGPPPSYSNAGGRELISFTFDKVLN